MTSKKNLAAVLSTLVTLSAGSAAPEKAPPKPAAPAVKKAEPKPAPAPLAKKVVPGGAFHFPA